MSAPPISRGNDRGAVLRRHVLRNALVPVVTFLAQTMAEIVAAGIVVEQVFAIPGLGRLLVASISNRTTRGAGHRGDPGLLGGAFLALWQIWSIAASTPGWEGIGK